MKNQNDFTTGAIFPKMIRFMVPILGALILQAMYSAVDLLVVGRFAENQDVSGVSTGTSVVMLFQMCVTSLSTGVTVLIGQYLGEKRPQKIGPVIGGAICLFAAIALFITIFMVTLANPLANLMQAPEEAVETTAAYIRICGGGMVFIIAYNLISGIFRGMGDSRHPLIFVGYACVANILGDLLMVGVFKMGASGAAIATVFAQAVSVVLSLLMIRRMDLSFQVTRKDIRFGPEIRQILHVGVPMAVQSLLTDFSFMAINAFVNRLGLIASSGYGIANKIFNFIMLIPSAIMQSMSSFVSQNVGANNEGRAKKSLGIGIAIGVIMGAFTAVSVFFWGDTISFIFTTDPDVAARSFEYLKGCALEAVVTSIMFSFVGYYSGHGLTVFVMSQSLTQTLLVRLPMSYFMSTLPNASLTPIGFAAPTATTFGILINLGYFIILEKRRKKETKTSGVR